jgi:hypothetical protein
MKARKTDGMNMCPMPIAAVINPPTSKAARDGKDQEVSAHLRRNWMQHEGKPTLIS